ncbi:hypothetical protein EG344_15260 [Chryseobacterium sp. G0162]|uniref:hypothetical protein n=1 Tax=Chryseobacterium sp. G0162 TaxID=2487063 RepID=UPI000F4F2760|nr:hypothetical protein [Chryseobacterium sp. G0162]AZB10075.1 hypothetical protein EG344_15260 [Chryseobacterium sp. G0162]
MKKLLLASLFLLTLTACERDEAEMQVENKVVPSSSLKSITAKGSEKMSMTLVQVDRWYSYKVHKHFFGINTRPPGQSPNELDWKYEQIGFALESVWVPGNSGSSVISMIHPKNLDNLLVTTAVERQSAEAQGYVVIENLGYSIPQNTMNASPVYRYFRPSKSGHLYTKNFAELGNGGNGWIYEGIAFYAY